MKEHTKIFLGIVLFPLKVVAIVIGVLIMLVVLWFCRKGMGRL